MFFGENCHDIDELLDRSAWEDDDNDSSCVTNHGPGWGGWKRNFRGSQCGSRPSPQHPTPPPPCLQRPGRKHIYFSNWWIGSRTPSCWVFQSWLKTPRDMSMRDKPQKSVLRLCLSLGPQESCLGGHNHAWEDIESEWGRSRTSAKLFPKQGESCTHPQNFWKRN